MKLQPLQRAFNPLRTLKCGTCLQPFLSHELLAQRDEENVEHYSCVPCAESGGDVLASQRLMRESAAQWAELTDRARMAAEKVLKCKP